MACLAKDLPVAFRINGSGRFADHLRDKFESDFFSHFAKGDLKVHTGRAGMWAAWETRCSSSLIYLTQEMNALQIDDEIIRAPFALPWYPNGYAWQLNFTRQQLRRLPLLNEIHDFIKKVASGQGVTFGQGVKALGRDHRMNCLYDLKANDS